MPSSPASSSLCAGYDDVSYNPWTPWTETHVVFDAPLPKSLGMVIEERASRGGVALSEEVVVGDDIEDDENHAGVSISSSREESVVCVSLIRPKSPSEKLGVIPGSLIVRVDGKETPYERPRFRWIAIMEVRDMDIVLRLTLRKPTLPSERLESLKKKEKGCFFYLLCRSVVLHHRIFAYKVRKCI